MNAIETPIVDGVVRIPALQSRLASNPDIPGERRGTTIVEFVSDKLAICHPRRILTGLSYYASGTRGRACLYGKRRTVILRPLKMQVEKGPVQTVVCAVLNVAIPHRIPVDLTDPAVASAYDSEDLLMRPETLRDKLGLFGFMATEVADALACLTYKTLHPECSLSLSHRRVLRQFAVMPDSVDGVKI